MYKSRLQIALFEDPRQNEKADAYLCTYVSHQPKITQNSGWRRVLDLVRRYSNSTYFCERRRKMVENMMVGESRKIIFLSLPHKNTDTYFLY